MGTINILKEKICGQYEYSNVSSYVSGDYDKDGLDNNNLTNLTGVCYSSDKNTFYGSFNSKINSKFPNMEYIIYETEPQYKEVIEGLIKEIEKKI
jgi:hypothetical protein